MKKKVIVGICGGVVGLVVIIVVVLLLMRESFYTVTFMVDDSVYQTIEKDSSAFAVCLRDRVPKARRGTLSFALQSALC